MPASSLTCPECQAVLKSAKPVAPGTVVTCPKCEVMFAAPSAKPKPAAVGGFEVVDDEAEARPRKAKPAPREPAKKATSEGDARAVRDVRSAPRKTSNQLLIALGAIAAIFLCLGGLAFGMWKLINSFGDDPMVYMPEDADVVACIRTGELEKVVPGQSANPAQMPKLPWKLAVLGLRDEGVSEIYVSRLKSVGFGVGGGEGMVGVVLTDKPFKKDELVKDLGPAKVIEGQNTYEQPLAPGMALSQIVPTNRLIVMALGGDRSIAEYARRAGRVRIDPDISGWRRQLDDDHFWVAWKTDATARQGLGNSYPNIQGLNTARGVLYHGKATGNSVEFRIGVVCQDSSTAKNLLPEFEKSFLKEMGKGKIPLIPFPIPGDLVNEFKASAKGEVKEDVMEIVGTVSVDALQKAATSFAMSQMMGGMMGGQPGGGRR
jgi:hypothetical protein